VYVSPARVCHLYYGMGLTQQQIAARLGVSRISVSRLLQQARADGIVTISIDFHGYYPDVEEALAEAYPGCMFVVADPLSGAEDQVKESIAQTASGVVTSMARRASRVAIGWGSTLRQVAAHVRGDLRDSLIVPLVGGQVGAGVDLHATTIAEAVARRAGARCARLFAPAVASSVEEKQSLVTSRLVAETLRNARMADLAVFSVGAPFSASSTLREAGYYSLEEVALLRTAGAECDIISMVYLDADGTPCCTDLTDRTVAISAAELRAVPRKLCIAGGESKRLAVALALESGFCDVLVTDAHTAEYLLGRAQDAGRAAAAEPALHRMGDAR
jgi:DNA-binding transcriptional regulator LsrR (DeoR family)